MLMPFLTACTALDELLAYANGHRLGSFVKLARTIHTTERR